MKVIAASFLLLAVFAFGQTPNHKGVVKKKDSAKADVINKSNQQEDAPNDPQSLTVTGQQKLPAEPSQKECCENTSEKIQIEQDLTRYTGWLVAVGAIQFFVLCGHLWVFHGHKTSFEKLAASAKENSTATKNALHLTFRPKIIIRGIVVNGLEKLNRQTPMNELSEVLKGGHYTVANVGGLPATIQWVREGTWCGKGLPMERPDEQFPGRKETIPLAAGESKKIAFPNIVLNVNDALDLIDGNTWAYFIVQVRYADSQGVIRETSACRRFEGAYQRFLHSEDTDYEYAD